MNDAHEMLRIARERYTTKHYNGQKIPREAIEELMEILRLAPSSVNSQPWKFFLISSDESKKQFAETVLDFNKERVLLASDVIVFAVPEKISEEHLQKLLNKEIADGRYKGLETESGLDAGRRHFVGLHSKTVADSLAWETAQTYIALGIAMFASAGMNIDSTALEGLDYEKVDAFLNLKEKGLRSVVALSLGYRAENDSNAARPKSRLNMEDVWTVL